MRPATTATEVLQAMEWMLTHIGWTQFTWFRDKDGFSIPFDNARLGDASSMCLTGALGLVECESPAYIEAHDRLRAAAKTDVLSYFNDAPGRTKEEVLSVVRKAIEAT